MKQSKRFHRQNSSARKNSKKTKKKTYSMSSMCTFKNYTDLNYY